MLPTATLREISPTAAKIYLTLLSLRNAATPHITASLADLSARSSNSTRVCQRAIRELLQRQIIRRLPRKYHQPSAYLLLHPQSNTPTPSPLPAPNTPIPSPLLPADLPTPSSLLPTNMPDPSTLLPTNRPIPSPSLAATPIPDPKNPNTPNVSPLLTQMLAYLFDPADSATHDQLQSLYQRLTPHERGIAVAVAKTYHNPTVLSETRP